MSFYKSEIHVDASHEGSLRHGVSSIDFVALCQQVLAFHEEACKVTQTVADIQIPKNESFLLFLSLRDGSIEATDVLHAAGGCPPSLMVVDTGI